MLLIGSIGKETSTSHAAFSIPKRGHAFRGILAMVLLLALLPGIFDLQNPDEDDGSEI
jgi:hypothetical protein